MPPPRVSLDESAPIEPALAAPAPGSTLEERFERITRLAQRLLDTPIAVISLAAADRQWFKSVEGLSAEETSRAVSFCHHAVPGDDVLVVLDARVDERFASDSIVTSGTTVVFYAGCPLRTADGVMLGSLSLVDSVPREFGPEDAQCLRDLAALAENELTTMMDSAVQADLVAQIGAEKRRSLVDPLTRLWNREGIFEVLEGEIAPALAEKEPAAIIMADLDHFKKVNDELGHPIGDEVLRQAARRMLQAVREVDAVGRYGGEEFMIVLGAVDGGEHALTIAERIRARVSQDPITTEAGSVTISVSLGVAVSHSGGTVDALVQAADSAMYQAKRAGRNRSVVTECGPTPAAKMPVKAAA